MALSTRPGVYIWHWARFNRFLRQRRQILQTL